jgi:hypothetical protein
MILPILFFLLAAGALASAAIPTRFRTAHFAVSLIPGAAAFLLAFPLPFSRTFSIAWEPSNLFPGSIAYAASPQASAFAVYFCMLLFLLEWTRPLRASSGRFARASIFLLALASILAGCAANPLSVLISWALLDFVSLLAASAGNPSVEIGTLGVSATLDRAMAVFALNVTGSALVLLSLYGGGNPTFPLAISAIPDGLPAALFFCGLAVRLAAAPVQIVFARGKRKENDTEILLSVAAPASALCLLSNLGLPSAVPSAGTIVLLVFLMAVLIWGAWRWFAAPDPHEQRASFFFLIPGFAFVSALLTPDPRICLAAGSMLVLGGGVLSTHIGFLRHRPWLSFFPVVLGLLAAGFPFSPFSIFSSNVYPALAPNYTGFIFLYVVFQVLLVGAVFRTAFQAVDEFPSNEPVFLFSFSFGSACGLAAALYPGWSTEITFQRIGLPLALLTGAAGAAFLLRRLHRSGRYPRWLPREASNPFDRASKPALVVFRFFSAAFSAVESFLSGEGAMLWSLGIALLIYLMLRGG